MKIQQKGKLANYALYPKELKIKLVKLHLDDKIPTDRLAEKYSIARSLIYRWKKLYVLKGEKGFDRSYNKKKPLSINKDVHSREEYTPEFKLMVAACAMEESKTQTQIAHEFNISPSDVSKWKVILKNKGHIIFDPAFSRIENAYVNCNKPRFYLTSNDIVKGFAIMALAVLILKMIMI